MAPSRNVHTQSQKEFIVRKIAAFDPPRAITAAFCAVYPDTACNENDVMALDPAVSVIAPDLYALFLSERERVLLDPKSAPFADQKACEILLSRMVDIYKNNNQFAEARSTINQLMAMQGVGVKGPTKSAATPDAAGEPIAEIRRTIVDPAVSMDPEPCE